MNDDIFKDLILPTDEEVRKETSAAKIRAALTGRIVPEDELVKVRENAKLRRGDKNVSKRPEVRAKISKAISGRKLTPEHILACKAGGVGKAGGHNKGTKQTPEGIQKQKKKKKNREYKTCIHCNKSFTGGMFVRWHGEKCTSRPLADGEVRSKRFASIELKRNKSQYTYHTPKGDFLSPTEAVDAYNGEMNLNEVRGWAARGKNGFSRTLKDQ